MCLSASDVVPEKSSCFVSLSGLWAEKSGTRTLHLGPPAVLVGRVKVGAAYFMLWSLGFRDLAG